VPRHQEIERMAYFFGKTGVARSALPRSIGFVPRNSSHSTMATVANHVGTAKKVGSALGQIAGTVQAVVDR